MEVFLTTGRRTALISCVAMWLCAFVHTPHTIQVWGIVSFVVVIGLSTTFRLINGIISTLSVFIPTHRTGDATVFFDFIMKKLLLFLALLGTFTVGCDKDDFEDSNVVEDEIVNPSGLPKPKANEIYYTTTDGVMLNLEDKDFYSKVSSHSVKQGNVFVMTFTQDLSQIRISFEDIKRLKTIRLPEGITAIRNSAFGACSGLVGITLPESVTAIGKGAFSSCSSLTSITIPNSVTSIEDGTFWGCSNLTSITIPESVTRIGQYAFSGCGSLTSITIPEGVTSIEYCTFEDCGSLTSITIPEGVTRIGQYAFSGCGSLTSITIPKGVTSIEYCTFSGCSSLTSITLPEGVTSIRGYAFSGCGSLTSITIPEGVTSIGEYAFNGCI